MFRKNKPRKITFLDKIEGVTISFVLLGLLIFAGLLVILLIVIGILFLLNFI